MKKLLFTLLIALTMCLLLAFVVSAEDYELVDNLGDPSWYTGNYELMTDKTSKVVLSNGDGTYTAYPTYYVAKYSISVSDGKITSAHISGFDYSFVNEKCGTSYEDGAVYKIEIPNGVTTIVGKIFGHHGGHTEVNVTEVIMPDSVLTLEGHSFRKSANLKKVVFSKNLVDLGEYTFQESSVEEIYFPAGSEEILDMSGNYLFYSCKNLKSVDLSTRKVNMLGSCCFYNCTSLGKITLSDTIESFGGQCFYLCENMYFASDFLPTNLKSVGFHFMTGAKHANSVLYFPEGFTELSTTYAFAEGKYYNENGLTLVFLGKMTNINLGQYRQSASGKLKIILTKNDYSDLKGNFVTTVELADGSLAFISKTDPVGGAITVKENGTLTITMCAASFPASNGKVNGVDANGNTLQYVNTSSFEIYFCNGGDVEFCYGIRSDSIDNKVQQAYTPVLTFDRQGHMDAGVHYDLTEVLSVANCGIDGVIARTCALCSRVENDIEKATGNHTAYEVSPCADKCEVCLLYIQKETQNHAYSEYFSYAKGFTCQGEYGISCGNEGCASKTVEEKAALVNDLGFSVPEAAAIKGIIYCYSANGEVIGEYERVNKCTVSLGFLVAGGDNFTVDQKVIDGEFAVILDRADIIINYATATGVDDKDIVIAGSVIEKKEDGIVKTYFQGETNKATTDYVSPTYGTLYGISLNDLKG